MSAAVWIAVGITLYLVVVIALILITHRLEVRVHNQRWREIQELRPKDDPLSIRGGFRNGR